MLALIAQNLTVSILHMTYFLAIIPFASPFACAISSKLWLLVKIYLTYVRFFHYCIEPENAKAENTMLHAIFLLVHFRIAWLVNNNYTIRFEAIRSQPCRHKDLIKIFTHPLSQSFILRSYRYLGLTICLRMELYTHCIVWSLVRWRWVNLKGQWHTSFAHNGITQLYGLDTHA